MDNNIQRMECSLDDETIYNFLRFVTQKNKYCCSPWCLKNEADCLVPQLQKITDFSETAIQAIEEDGLYELILYLYPYKTDCAIFATYEDFLKSDCYCCIVYYDCGYLNIYTKDIMLFQELQDKLNTLKAEDMIINPDESDCGLALHP